METGELQPPPEPESSRDTQPTRSRVWPVFLVPVIALLATLAFQIVVAGVVVARELGSGMKPAELSERVTGLFAQPGLFMLLAAGGQLAFGAAALLPAWLSPVPVRQRLGLVPVHQTWTIYPLTILGSLAPLAIGIGAAQQLARVLPPDPTVAMLLERMTLGWGVLFVLFIALAPGFCEELLFRGYIQRRLLERWRPWTAITVTSVIFGLLHVTPHAILVALPLGVWFGAIAWRTGSILPGIACHAFINGGVNAWRMVVKFGEVPEPVQRGFVIGMFGLGTACFLVACRQLVKTRASSGF